jgi:hypothetical protein
LKPNGIRPVQVAESIWSFLSLAGRNLGKISLPRRFRIRPQGLAGPILGRAVDSDRVAERDKIVSASNMIAQCLTHIVGVGLFIASV